MSRSIRRIRIAYLNILFDSLILLTLGGVLIVVHRLFSDEVAFQNRMEHRRLLESMSASANNYVIRQLDFLSVFVQLVNNQNVSKEQWDKIRRTVVPLNAIYRVSERMVVNKVYLAPGRANYLEGLDISNTFTARYIREAIRSGKRQLAPLHASIITAKDALSFVFPTESGAIVAEPELSGLFQTIGGASLLNLYQDSIILLLKPDSNDVLYRSKPEAYPYWEFSPDAPGRVSIGKEWHNFDDLVLPGMNIRLVVLTPTNAHEGVLNAFRWFSIVLFAAMVGLYTIRRFWEHRAVFHPLQSFLDKIRGNPMGEVVLGSNYSEWATFERIYNESVRKIHSMSEELRQSEARAKALLDANPDLMFLFSETGVFLDCHYARESTLFAPPQQFSGRNVREVMPSDVAELTLSAIETVRQGKCLALFDYTLDFGGIRHYEARLVACGPSKYLAIVHDITERKTAEQALRRNEQQLRSITDNLPGAIFQLFVKSSGEMGLQFVSERAKEMIAIDLEPLDTLYERFISCIHPDDRVKFEESVNQAVSQRNRWEFEGRIQRGDGTQRWIRAVSQPSDADDETIFNGLVLDITQLKKAESDRIEMERRMLHVQKLESLGVLAGGMAHDFNNILMAVLGHAELALMNTPTMSPARENIQEIVNAVNRSAELCRQMLAYAGKGKFIIEAISLSDLVKEMVHLLQAAISKKALLNLSLERNLPNIEGDPTQIRQILLNLITNASEAIGDRSGIITVSTGGMHCDGALLDELAPGANLAAGLYVYMEVNDTGCGMDGETLKHIYEPFFTTKFTGRGLGMAALLGIVQGHKGAVRVQSEVGKGSTFRILFPPSARWTESSSEQAARQLPEKLKGGILLVDDEESIRSVSRSILEAVGFEVLLAANGREALRIYAEESHRIDLVLLDLTMPQMDGEETFRELRKMNPNVRVIISSGFTEVDITTRFAGQGLAGFIQKPYSKNEIAKKIRQVLEPAALCLPDGEAPRGA